MDTILQQMPIVINALNVGFLQTLKLFFVTLLGAIPLGLVIAFGSMSRFKPLSALTRVFVWIIRGTPLMIQLLIVYYFPGLVLKNPIWGGGEEGRFAAAAVSTTSYPVASTPIILRLRARSSSRSPMTVLFVNAMSAPISRCAASSGGVRSYTERVPNSRRQSQLRSPGLSVYPSKITICIGHPSPVSAQAPPQCAGFWA